MINSDRDWLGQKDEIVLGLASLREQVRGTVAWTEGGSTLQMAERLIAWQRQAIAALLNGEPLPPYQR